MIARTGTSRFARSNLEDRKSGSVDFRRWKRCVGVAHIVIAVPG